jgi:hypothetical protein
MNEAIAPLDWGGLLVLEWGRRLLALTRSFGF